MTFCPPTDIRIWGTHIGIEAVLYDYIHCGQSPEAIAARYPSLTLEQVYATITYYLRNREQVAAYLENWLTYNRQARKEQERTPLLVVVRLQSPAAEHRQKSVPVS